MKFKQDQLYQGQLAHEFANSCHKQGIECYLDYDPREFGNRRFDAVIVKNNKIIFLVEIKCSSITAPQTKEKWLETEQGEWYSSFNLPIFYLLGWENMLKTIKGIREALKLYKERR